MSYYDDRYDDRPEDLLQDTKKFLTSDYGKYLMSTLEETASGYLSRADNVECPYPERYLAKHSALQEVLNLVHAPLDDNTLSRV